MMRFVDQHVKTCPVCAKDLILPDEVEKIREFIFPESKVITPIQVDNADDEDVEEQQEEDGFTGDSEDELEDEDEEDDEI